MIKKWTKKKKDVSNTNLVWEKQMSTIKKQKKIMLKTIIQKITRKKSRTQDTKKDRRNIWECTRNKQPSSYLLIYFMDKTEEDICDFY